MQLPKEIRALACSLHSRGTTDTRSIEAAERALGFRLPEDYREFARLSDGAEGLVGDRYVSFWRISELAELNELIRGDQLVPGFIAFGTDGGTQLYGFDRRTAEGGVAQAPVVGLDWKRARRVADSFVELLRTLGGESLQPAPRQGLGFLRGRKSGQAASAGDGSRNASYIHPLLLGGHPGELENRPVLPLRETLRAATFWNARIAAQRRPGAKIAPLNGSSNGSSNGSRSLEADEIAQPHATTPLDDEISVGSDTPRVPVLRDRAEDSPEIGLSLEELERRIN